MKRSLTGSYVGTTAAGEKARAFVPHPLPPSPRLDLGDDQERLSRALLALGRLDGVSSILPDAHLFLYMYVRKEAVLSSQIEGTQSSLADLLLFELAEAPGVPFDDVVEVSNYVAALEHGLRRIRKGSPISNRLIRELHEILLRSGRGKSRSPGQFRRVQNWIGGGRPSQARFIPPPADRVEDAMAALERFLNDEPAHTPAILKAALGHVQFETIHPFLDGNGRVGRLLITLILCQERVLREPLLYLSLYFKEHRSRYYELLDQVRTDGDWEEWVGFFVTGVEETATAAIETAHRLLAVAEKDRAKIQTAGRMAGSALQVQHALQRSPIATITRLSEMTRLSVPTITKALAVLQEMKLIREITGRKRNRVFSYDRYLAILQKGTERP